MGADGKHDVLCIKKFLRFSVRRSCRCASEHWVLFSLVLLLYLLHKSSPGFFAFVLSSSPVIICAALLLSVLLSYGSTHLPEEIDECERTTTYVSVPKAGQFPTNIQFEAHQRISVPSFKGNKIGFKDWEMKNTGFDNASGNNYKHVELDDSVPLLNRVDAGDVLEGTVTSVLSIMTLHQYVGMEEPMKDNQGRDSKDPFCSKDKGDRCADLCQDDHLGIVDGKEIAPGLCSSIENDRRNGETVAKANQDIVSTDSQIDEVREVSEDKPANQAGACRWGRAFSVRQRKRRADLIVEVIDAAVESQSHSFICSPIGRVGSHNGSSGFDRYKPENSSPHASMVGITPVLDAVDPPSGDDFPSPSPNPIVNDDSGNDSKNISTQDSQVDSYSNNESDISKAKDDAKDEPAFLRTAVDEKNVMDLGYSEVERNRRLEILMAKRKSRKYIRFDLDNDKNLIDLDGNDVVRGADADEFSSLPMQAHPISVPRMNPFDLPSDSDEATIPGSAPSILHPQKNPFDLPFEQSDDSDDHQEFEKDPYGAMFLRRHDSFSIGSHGRRLSRFKPCFVLDPMDLEEASTGSFERQFSDRSVSRLSSVTESDTVSSVADQEDRNEFIKKDFMREHGCSDGINLAGDEPLCAVANGIETSAT